MQKRKKRWGDRWDAYRVRGLDPMHTITPYKAHIAQYALPTTLVGKVAYTVLEKEETAKAEA